MATAQRSGSRKTVAKSASAKKRVAGTAPTGITKAKVKRVARKAKASLEDAAHDANLALKRAGRKLKREAVKLEAELQEAKGPAKRKAKRVGRKIASALESAGASLSALASRAKRGLASLSKPATKSPARKRVAKKAAS